MYTSTYTASRVGQVVATLLMTAVLTEINTVLLVSVSLLT